MALFHAESSILGRYLSSPALDRLTADVEHEEMRHLGMTDPDNKAELRQLILAEADRLASIRRARLAKILCDSAARVDLGKEDGHV
jgi:hypothetical protein